MTAVFVPVGLERAQALRELMGYRAGGRDAAGERMIELFEQLTSRLSHFQWACQGVG